jgi:hypothetical protein
MTTKLVTKKWINLNEFDSPENVYRITFKCKDSNVERIRYEILECGELIEEEVEVTEEKRVV